MSNETFEAHVRDHHQAVYASARRVTGNDADAADVTQQVFLRVLEGRLTLPAGEAAERVLRWWAVRTALTLRRAADRRRRREDRHAMNRTDATSPEPTLETQEQRHRLWALIDALPRELRVPLVLRFHEEQSYAQIGGHLAIAESTAHERVRKALAALRARLAGAGLAAWAASLEGRIAQAQPVAPASALRDRLLELASPVASSTAKLVGWLGVGVLAVGLTWTLPQLWPELRGDGATESEGASELAEASARVSEGSSVAAIAAEPKSIESSVRPVPHEKEVASQDEPRPRSRVTDVTGWVEGRIRFGSEPVAGAEVSVISAERQGKMARYGTKGLTDDTGRFRIRVEVAPDGGHYHILATHADLASWRSDRRLVQPDETTDFGEVEVVAAPDERPGRFVLQIELVDPNGAPLADAKVRLERIRSIEPEVKPRATYWWTHERHELETDAVTDQYGIARLEGQWLGRKRLEIDPAGKSLATESRRLVISEEGPQALPIWLEAPRAIAGQVRMLDGSVPRGSLQVTDAERRLWRYGSLEPDGRFHVGGLAPGAWQLMVEGKGCSKAVEIVEAGELDVTIVLKPEGELRDVGNHAAEIHGRIVRASDGSPVSVADWFAVDVDRVDVPEGVDVTRDLLPNLLFPPPVQRAVGPEEPPLTDRFDLTGLTPGHYVVRLEVEPAALWVTMPIELGEREIRTDVILEAHAPAKVRGRVSSEDGAVEALVMVTGVGPHSDEVIRQADALNRSADGRGFLTVNASERRSRDSRYEQRGLPPSIDFRFVALHPDYEPEISEVVRLEAGEERTLDMKFRVRRRD